METTILCTGCNIEKPSKNFYLIRGKIKSNKCNLCIKHGNNLYTKPLTGSKYCIGCNKSYDVSNFKADPKDTSGLYVYCFNCIPHELENELKQENLTIWQKILKIFGYKKTNKKLPNNKPINNISPYHGLFIKILNCDLYS